MFGLSGYYYYDDDGDYVLYCDDDIGYESLDVGWRVDGVGMLYGVLRSVVYLVEEGMMLDEIWRLEEEERQLDDVIQWCG